MPDASKSQSSFHISTGQHGRQHSHFGSISHSVSLTLHHQHEQLASPSSPVPSWSRSRARTSSLPSPFTTNNPVAHPPTHPPTDERRQVRWRKEDGELKLTPPFELGGVSSEAVYHLARLRVDRYFEVGAPKPFRHSPSYSSHFSRASTRPTRERERESDDDDDDDAGEESFNVTNEVIELMAYDAATVRLHIRVIRINQTSVPCKHAFLQTCIPSSLLTLLPPLSPRTQHEDDILPRADQIVLVNVNVLHKLVRVLLLQLDLLVALP